MIESLVTSAAFGAFSRSAIYTPPGEDAEPVEVEVIVDLGIQHRDGITSQVVDEGDFVDFLSGDVGPERGGTLANVEGYDGRSWRLGSRESDDGEVSRFRILHIEPDND